MAEAFSGMTDVLIGYDTDLHFENGDLMLTSGIDYIERELYKLLITYAGDWKTDYSIGASPDAFIGEQNTREMGIVLKDYLRENLRATVTPASLEVRVVPTDYSSISVFIDVFVQNADITTVPFTFDFVTGSLKLTKRDEKVTPTKSSQTLIINDNSSKKRSNKYWDTIRDGYTTN